MAEVASAYVSLLPSAKGFGRQLDAQVGPQLDAAGKSGGKRFGGTFGAAFKGALAGVGIATAVRAGVDLLSSSIGEAREAQKVGAQTAQVIKTTGGAAKVTARDVGKLSNALSLHTGIDDEAIQTGSNLLLTFKNVRDEVGLTNKIFSRATAASLDLSAAGFGSVDSAAKQLGKALNDPVKGMTALGRSGVTFSDSQKKQIKAMVKSNDLLGAQKIILKEVESQVGGSAAAQATAGDKMTVAWANVKEQLGTALLPLIDKFANAMTTKVVPALSKTISFLQKNPQILIAFGVAIAAVAAGFVIAFVAANALIIGIAALVAGVVYAYAKFPQFREAVNSTFQFLKTIVMTVLPFVIAYIKGWVTTIVGIFKLVKAVLTGDWKGAWAAIKQIVSGVVAMIKAIISAWWAGVKALFRLGGQAIVALIKAYFGLLRGAASAGISALLNAVKSIPGKIKSGLGNLGALLYNAGRELINGLINGIKSKIGDVGGAMKDIAGKVKGFLPGSPVKEGPLTSWNNGGAGKRLIDMGIIDGVISRRGALSSAMNDLTANASLTASVRTPVGARLDVSDLAIGGASGAGLHPIVLDGMVVGHLRGVVEEVVFDHAALAATTGRQH